MLKAAITMLAYAAALLAVGAVTAGVAPPGANAITAFAIPALIAVLMIACAVLTLMHSKKRVLGMIGVHLGLVIPILAIVGPAMRLSPSWSSAATANGTLGQIRTAVDAGEDVTIRATPDGGAAAETGVVFVNAETGLRPFGYQTVGLASVAALSAFAFVALLLHRPAVPKPAEPAEPAERAPDA